MFITGITCFKKRQFILTNGLNKIYILYYFICHVVTHRQIGYYRVITIPNIEYK